MREKALENICGLLIAMALGVTSVWAKEERIVVPESPLTEAGQKLEARYAEQLKALQAEILNALPKVDEEQVAAFMKAYQQETAASDDKKNTLWAERRASDKDPAKD